MFFWRKSETTISVKYRARGPDISHCTACHEPHHQPALTQQTQQTQQAQQTQVETLDYSSWSFGVKQRIGGRRVPLAGTIELTRRCNNRCGHCYNNLPASDRQGLAEELRTDELIHILDETAAAGCVWLLLTGGEIFLRPDFREIYTHAKQNGLLVTLFTNGTLITPEMADFLANQRPFSIEITLYGATRGTYERVTGNPGSFKQCLRGIGHLRDRGLPLNLKATVSTLNCHEIQAMKRYVENDLGMPFRFDAQLNARCDRSPGPLNVRLSPEEVVQLDLADPERAEALRDFARRRHGHGAGDKKGAFLYPCGGGAHSFAIDPYGRLRACAISPAEGFDLRSGSFQEGWGRFLARLRERKIDRDTKCLMCTLQELCGMCPANGELECEDPQQPVDFLCRVTHLRAYALGIPMASHGDCEYCPGGQSHAEMIQAVGRFEEWRLSAERCA
jgi:radical SAM protein with 4Fe4S-binding SPASM domain